MANAGHTAAIRYTGVCGHTHTIVVPPPTVGELQFCYSCDDYVIVADVPDYWFAVCRRQNCWSKLSQNESTARQQADQHMGFKRTGDGGKYRWGHVVVIRHNGAPVKEFDPDMMEWFDRLDAAQRVALVKSSDAK